MTGHLPEPGLERDRVFAALTRPQMLLGVPYTVVVVNLIVTAELFLLFGSVLVLPLTLALHLGGVALSANEPRILDIWLVRLRCCPRVPNHKVWRCNSYRP